MLAIAHRGNQSSGKSYDKSKTYDKQVQAARGRSDNVKSKEVDPLDLLYSSSEDSDIRMVRVSDQGSHSKCLKVQVQGVPAYGIIDSGADFTIMGGKLVAAAARLEWRDFKKADKTPRTYDRKPFTLKGRMDLDVSLGGVTMQTPVYIKMDAQTSYSCPRGYADSLGSFRNTLMSSNGKEEGSRPH